MEDKLIKTLKNFRGIRPDENFAARSRREILAVQQSGFHQLYLLKLRLLDSLKFSGALVLASLLIFILFGGLSAFNIKNLSPTILTSFNENKLMVEARAIDFEIELQELRYYERSAQEVAALFDEVLKDENTL